MKRSLLIVMLLYICGWAGYAQSFEEYRQKKQAEYGEYKEKTQKEFEEYRSRLNSEFAEYMRRAWVWKESRKSVADPKDKIPDVVPVVLPEFDEIEIPEDNEIPFDEIVPIVFDDPEPISVVPIEYKPKPLEKKIGFSFYGTPCFVRFDMDHKVKLKNCSEGSVADMWNDLSAEAYDNILYDCQKMRDDMALCDWAYLKMTCMISAAVYGAGTNEAVVLSAFIMNQSGFRIRMGRSGERLCLLVATTDDMYDRTYWELDGTHYYLSEDMAVKGLYVFDTEFPNEKSLRLSLDSEQHFASKKSAPRRLRSKRYQSLEVTSTVNENTMTFYSDYPSTYRRGASFSQWYHYANAPVSRQVKSEVYPRLKSAISDKSQQEAANILLNFVQTAFEYKTDDEAWGYERSFFPEETLYYPYCDCEDRSILFSRLVRDLMGLDVVLLYYPGHLATAVCFTENVSGDFLSVNGRKFVVCDPTYINAVIGMTMPGMDNSNAKVLIL